MDTRSTTPAVPLDVMMFRVASVCEHYRTPVGSPADLAGLLEELGRNRGLALDFWMVVSQMIGGEDDLGLAGGERVAQARMLQERALEAITRVTTGFGVAELRAIDAESGQATVEMASHLAGHGPYLGTMAGEVPAAAETVTVRRARVADEAPVVAAEAMAVASSEPADDAAEKYREMLRARLEKEWLESQAQEAAAALESKAARQRVAAKSEREGRPEAGRSASPARRSGTRVWVADEPARKGAGEDFRQQLFGAASSIPVPPDPQSARPVRFRMPLALRMWARAWRPIVPPLRPARSGWRTGLRLAGAMLLLAGGVAMVHAQRSGELPQGLFHSGLIQRYGTMVRDAVASLSRPDDASASVAVEGSAGADDSSAAKRDASAAKRRRRATSDETSLAAAAPVAQTGSSPAAADSAKADEFADGAPVHIEGAEVWGAAGPVTVASPAMKVDLVSSPSAESASGAGNEQVDGRVVMHAVISKSGTVEEVQVLEGDAALREAAIRTVRGRRYSPYMVNGEPVEVTTTLTVNFKIDN